ncbi:MAG: hypothetical protein K2Q22_03025, partial [Cytophagales bacterium]|nr:hypothetical protein [Cytophagales bacterium]
LKSELLRVTIILVPKFKLSLLTLKESEDADAPNTTNIVERIKNRRLNIFILTGIELLKTK